MVLKNKTSDNVSRWKEKRKWKTIKNAGKMKKVSPLVREKVKTGDIERLLNQVSGLMFLSGQLAIVPLLKILLQ